jgi:VWFA-related protein
VPFIAAMSALIVHVAPPVTAQTPTFTSHTRAVRVDVRVTRSGRPVTDLHAADFVVSDNGVPQRVDLVSTERVPLNLIFALDVSASVSGERLRHLREACGAVVKDLRAGDQAALVTFDQAVVIPRPLSADLADFGSALAEARGGGRTALVDALYTAMVLGESDAGRALVLVFTDGVETASWLTADQLLRTAQRTDVVVYGVLEHGESTILRDVSRASGGEVMHVGDSGEVGRAFATILDEFRHRYLVSFTPAGVAAEGWHRLDVKVRRRGRGLRVKARPGYSSSGN